LHAALLLHAALGDTTVLPLEPFGQKYVVRGTIPGPNGTVARLLAIGIRTDPVAGPRFVTAYPEESR